MTGQGPGKMQHLAGTLLETKLPRDHSNLLGGGHRPRSLPASVVAFGAQPRVPCSLCSLLLTESPKFPLSLRTSLVWLSGGN